MEFRNELDEATTLHWHGMHLPAAADGGPHQPVAPGAGWAPSWRVRQPAATLWYHPHPHGATERHVYRGLGGLFLIDDDEEAALALPREYGVDDIPVIVQDKTFGPVGRFAEGARTEIGMLGSTILVNGTAEPVLTVRTRLVRLRLINASTARCYAFGFAADRRFALIATDGGLLGAPVESTRILLSPGERAEIVVPMAAGETAVLRSFPHDLGVTPTVARQSGAADTLDILLLRAAPDLRASAPLPDRLAWMEPLTAPGAPVTRRMELRDFLINGRLMDPHRRAATAAAARRVEGHRLPAPDVRFRLALRFADYADPAVPYMYHYHLLWHEDIGMMGQFVVVEPGTERAVLNRAHGH